MEGLLLEFAPLFSEVKRRVAPSETADKWSAICTQFLRALQVKDMSTDGGLPPFLDNIWHECILNTRLYEALCIKLRGSFIHHTTVSEGDPEEERMSRVDQTVINYRKRFREEPESDLWEQNDATSPTFLNLYVKNLQGKTFQIAILSSKTILDLKTAVRYLSQIPVDEQRLIYAGRQLEDGRTLADYNLQNQSTIHLVSRVRGC